MHMVFALLCLRPCSNVLVASYREMDSSQPVLAMLPFWVVINAFVCQRLPLPHTMHRQDRKKMAKQVRRCYAENRKMARPLQYHLASATGASCVRVQSTRA